jgi:hypothetical protein
MQFDLMYYLHMTVADFDDNDMRDNEWLHSRLVKQRKDEQEALKKARDGGKV